MGGWGEGLRGCQRVEISDQSTREQGMKTVLEFQSSHDQRTFCDQFLDLL